MCYVGAGLLLKGTTHLPVGIFLNDINDEGGRERERQRERVRERETERERQTERQIVRQNERKTG